MPFNDIEINVTEEDISSQTIKIPVNLALKNNEKDRFEVVKVELSYDSSLTIISKARQVVPIKPGLLIYDREINTLDNVENFTPLSNIDTVALPFLFFFEHVVVLYKDGIPGYIVSSIALNPQALNQPKEVQIGIKIYCKDRPPFRGIFNLKIPLDVEILIPQDSDLELMQLNALDIRLFSNLYKQNYIIEMHWKSKLLKSNDIIEYYKFHGTDSTYQIVLRNNIVRRATIDCNNDGYSDYEMLDETGDGIPDKKYRFLDKVIMFDWEKEAVQ